MLTRNSFPHFTAAALLALLALTGCAGQGFNQRLAGGYAAVTFARDSSGLLLEAAVIGSEEALQVQGQADNARAALDITRSIHASGDLETAEAKLQATLLALDGLRDYIAKLDAQRGFDP